MACAHAMQKPMHIDRGCCTAVSGATCGHVHCTSSRCVIAGGSVCMYFAALSCCNQKVSYDVCNGHTKATQRPHKGHTKAKAGLRLQSNQATSSEP
jgi:hypothetical protein